MFLRSSSVELRPFHRFQPNRINVTTSPWCHGDEDVVSPGKSLRSGRTCPNFWGTSSSPASRTVFDGPMDMEFVCWFMPWKKSLYKSWWFHLSKSIYDLKAYRYAGFQTFNLGVMSNLLALMSLQVLKLWSFWRRVFGQVQYDEILRVVPGVFLLFWDKNHHLLGDVFDYLCFCWCLNFSEFLRFPVGLASSLGCHLWQRQDVWFALCCPSGWHRHGETAGQFASRCASQSLRLGWNGLLQQQLSRIEKK